MKYLRLMMILLLGMGGLWESWTSPEGEIVRTFCLVTTAANELMRPIHDRMPVIIPAEKQSLWLDNAKFEKAELATLFEPYPEHKMEMQQGPYRLQQAQR